MIGAMEPTPALNSPRHYVRYWLPDLVVWLAVAIGGTLLFHLTNWDLDIAAAYYVPDHPNTAWPIAEKQPWDFFYRAAPILIGIVAVGAVIAIIAGSLKPVQRLYRLYGLFILLTIALGPGLIVNTVLKDHFGRPRPRNVVEFGGQQQHLPPLVPGEQGMGKSFPCGHCSVGFVLVMFYFLNRRKRPAIAFRILGCVILFGALLGVGRIAGGAHYASDALWAGLICFGVGWALYYFLLNIPGREDAVAAGAPAGVQRPRLVIGGAVGLLLVILAGVLLATPQRAELRTVVHGEQPFFEVTINANRANLDITLLHSLTEQKSYSRPQTILPDIEGDPPTFDSMMKPSLEIPKLSTRQAQPPSPIPQTDTPNNPLFTAIGQARGFGAPGSRIRAKEEKRNAGFYYDYVIEEDGWLTDVEANVKIKLRADDLQKLLINLHSGNLMIRGLIPELRDKVVIEQGAGNLVIEEQPLGLPDPPPRTLSEAEKLQLGREYLEQQEAQPEPQPSSP